MFKVLVTSINPSKMPLPDRGTSSLIPERLKDAGDRLVQIEIAIDADRPCQHGQTTYEGDKESWIADWLPDQYGVRGKPVGDDASPVDLVAALAAANWLNYDILEGEEILDLPEPELPPGAIA
jgi:hypothetical protein